MLPAGGGEVAWICWQGIGQLGSEDKKIVVAVKASIIVKRKSYFFLSGQNTSCAVKGNGLYNIPVCRNDRDPLSSISLATESPPLSVREVLRTSSRELPNAFYDSSRSHQKRTSRS